MVAIQYIFFSRANHRHLTGQPRNELKRKEATPRGVDRRTALLNPRHFAEDAALGPPINLLRSNGLRMASAVHMGVLPERGNRDFGRTLALTEKSNAD